MEEDKLVALQSKNPEKIKSILKKFNEEHSALFDLSAFSISGQWSAIWKSIFVHLQDPELESAYPVCLNTIRILTRDHISIQNQDMDEDFKCLIKLAKLQGDSLEEVCSPNSTATVSEALKCLCNLVYQSSDCRRLFVRGTGCDRLLRRVADSSNQSYEIGFFDLKLLFLITALDTTARNRIQNDINGPVYLIHLLDQRLQEENISASDLDIICESLKVLFNITSEADDVPNQNEIQNRHLTSVIRRLLLRFGGLCNEKEQIVVTQAINLLTNISSSCLSELLIKYDHHSTSQAQFLEFEGWNVRILEIFIIYTKIALKQISDESSSATELIPPVLTVLVKCVRCNRTMRHYIRKEILPPLKDVSQRPEVGNELRNHLCRFLTLPDMILRDLAAELLFVCCKENVGRMIKYTGYGNAAGLFASRGLLDCRANKNADYSSDSEDSDTDEYKQVQQDVNPVLGCFESPKRSPLEGLSEEQKEYEAMQLVELMDKLQRSGIVQPCRISEDGTPEPVNHILELQEELPQQQLEQKRKC